MWRRGGEPKHTASQIRMWLACAGIARNKALVTERSRGERREKS